MLAYKAFNKDIQATSGKGIFQFEPGKTYEEDRCGCAACGFHCAEDPLDTLNYYRAMDTRFFIVEAAGDINQDGHDTRIACTQLTLVKEISRLQLATSGCLYMQKYPERTSDSCYVKKDRGRCSVEDDFVIVRGKSPQAAGVKGSWLFLLREKKGSCAIEGIWPVYIDGKEYMPDTWYGIRGGKICAKKN